TTTGSGARLASVSRAWPRPYFVSVAGWSPRAIARSSSSASSSSSVASASSLRAFAGEEDRRRRRVAVKPRPRPALLCTVVKVALEPPPGLVGGADDTGARGTQLGLGALVCDGLTGDVGEATEPYLRAGRKGLAVGARRREGSEHRACDDHRGRNHRVLAM